MLPFTEWVRNQVRRETKTWQIHFGVNLAREAFYLIKAYKARKLQVQGRIIPAKVRMHPPQPQARNEWQGNGWTLKSGIIVMEVFNFWPIHENKFHLLFPLLQQMTRISRSDYQKKTSSNWNKTKNIEKLLNVFVCSKGFFKYDSDNTDLLYIIDNRSWY